VSPSTSAPPPTSVPPPAPRRHGRSLRGLDFGPDAASFVSADEGWALADVHCVGCARLFHTVDGGRHWTAISRPALPGPRIALLGGSVDVYFADARNGYIFTSDHCPGRCVSVTHDGGRSWHSTALPPVAQVIAGSSYAYALSDSTAGHRSTVLRNAVGSDRWTRLALPAGAYRHWSVLKSSSPYIAAGGSTIALLRQAPDSNNPTRKRLGRLWVSPDSGSTWQRRGNPCTVRDGGATLVSVALDHPSALLLDCYDGLQSSQETQTRNHLYGSADAGTIWVRLADPAHVGGPEFMADNGAGHAIFVAAGGIGYQLRVTLDGAAHWHTILTGGGGGFGMGDLRMVSAQVGFVLGPTHYTPEHLYRTEDAGRTWRRILLPAVPLRWSPRCRPGSLRIQGGRQGSASSAAADVLVTNVGAQACRIAGRPRIALLGPGGTRLPVRNVSHGPYVPARTLRAHGGSADLAASWINWCGRPPGPLHIAVTFPHTSRAIRGWFGGPPAYDLVPPCLDRSRPSTIQIDSSTIVAPHSTEPCSVHQLRLTWVTRGQSSFHVVNVFGLTNIADRRCTLYGFPRVQLADPAGARIPVKIVDTNADLWPRVVGRVLALAPRHTAGLYVGGVGNPNGTCTELGTVTLRLALPADPRRILTAPITPGICSGAKLYISPLLPNTKLHKVR
jgi:photosystem II stability/assembly factor-like uncharacterized protein